MSSDPWASNWHLNREGFCKLFERWVFLWRSTQEARIQMTKWEKKDGTVYDTYEWICKYSPPGVPCDPCWWLSVIFWHIFSFSHFHAKTHTATAWEKKNQLLLSLVWLWLRFWMILVPLHRQRYNAMNAFLQTQNKKPFHKGNTNVECVFFEAFIFFINIPFCCVQNVQKNSRRKENYRRQ